MHMPKRGWVAGLLAAVIIAMAMPTALASFRLDYDEGVRPQDGIRSLTPTPARTAVQDQRAPRSALFDPSRLSVQDQIRWHWPDPATREKAVCLAGEETGDKYNVNAVSPGGTYLGLFQADSSFRATYGYGSTVKEQVLGAYRGYQDRGWQPWPPAARC